MNIYSKAGSKVIYLDENGYDSQRDHCNSLGLIRGKEYTVKYTVIHSYCSEVCLVEYPEFEFNTVMFGDK